MAYNGEATFEQWVNNNRGSSDASTLLNNYKTNGFTKTGDMSDAEYNAVSELYKAYLLNEGDKATKNTAISKVNDLRNSANQQEYIAYEKLKKYLPTQLKAQGLDGLGVSETALLQAYNNHSQNLGTIRSDYDTKVTDLENAYGKAVSDRNVAASDKAQTAYTEGLKTEKNNILNDYNDKLKSEAYYDFNGNLTREGYDAITKYLDDNVGVWGQDKVNQEKEALLKKSIVDVGAGVALDKYHSWNEKEDSIKKGDNFTVETGDGKTYKVQIAGKVPDSELSSIIHKIDDGKVFGYNNNLYVKIYGDVYKIEERFWGDQYDNLHSVFYPKE